MSKTKKNLKKIINAFLCISFAFLFLFGNITYVKAADKSVKICLIGNSYSNGHSLDTKLQSYLADKGYSASITTYAYNDAFLYDWAGSSSCISDLANGGYDAVILQEESHYIWQKPSDSAYYARKLANAAREGGANVFVYQTMSYLEDGEEGQYVYTNAYNNLANAIDAVVCRCGEAFWEYRRKGGYSVDEMFDDWQHPSNIGMRAVAMCMANTIAPYLESRFLSAACLKKTVPTASSDADGIHVSWDSVYAADGYRLYRKEPGDTDWTGIVNTESTSYIDTPPQKGVTYEYVVRAYKIIDGSKEFGPWRAADRASSIWLETPKLTDTDCITSGIQIFWAPVKGATSYRIYRKLPGDYYDYIDTVTGTSFTDSTAEKATGYLYTVRAYAYNARSGYSKDGIRGAYFDHIRTRASSDAKGIHLEWDALSGADGYRLYRKVPGSSWTALINTTETRYTDTEAEKGVSYEYTVRAYKLVNGKRALGDRINSDNAHIIWLETPRLTDAYTVSNGIKITWDKVDGATSYRIYRKMSPEESYDYYATVTGTSFTDKNAQRATGYIYTVRAYGSNSISDYSRVGISGVHLERIKISAHSDVNGVHLNWDALDGAKAYRLYRRAPGSSWTALINTTDTEYTDTEAEKGISYEYTVRAYVMVNGSRVLGDRSNADNAHITWLETPHLESTGSYDDGLKITWSKVDGATSYRIYRKTSPEESYDYYATVTDTSFTDPAVDQGMNYIYTVRAYGEKAISGYDKSGIAGTY